MTTPLLRARLGERADAPRILVGRNDGLGDLILTLPLIAALRAQLPHSRITVLVAAALSGLVELLPDIDGAIPDEGVLLKRHRDRFARGERRARRAALEARVRGEGFDLALLPYAEGASARLVHRAGIPVRVGPLRRAFCWRFNVRYRGSRKRSTAPEWQLNLGCLEALGLPGEFRLPRLRLPEPGAGGAGDAPPEPYAVLHPHKRSGTALSWPLERFVALAGRLAAAGYAVCVVGDAPDRAVLERHFAGLPGVRLEIGRPLAGLVALIAGARLFVGNSSGPLHIAGLTRTPHVGLFPQDRVSAPERWRTLPSAGAPQAFRDYLLASRFPKGCVVCEGERCPYFNCVASITLEQVEAGLERWGVLSPPGGTGPAAAGEERP